MARVVLEPTCEYTTINGNRMQLIGLSQKGLSIVRGIVPSAVREVELPEVIVKKVKDKEDAPNTAKPARAKRSGKSDGGSNG